MRILIDSGSYHALNVGDVAMLQAAIERLRGLWPAASISVVTNAPETLTRQCPGVRPVPLAGRVYFRTDRWFGRADRFLPRRLASALTALQDRMRHRAPATLAAIIAAKRLVALRRDWPAALTYVRAVERADLVVASGAGVFTDAFVENATGVLDTLEFALQQHVPAAAFGQGIGPVTSAALRRRMADVLPALQLIALRERRESVRLLDTIGVRSDRLIVTGDDAIEMARRSTPATLGGAIGVNLRVASYAGVTASGAEVIRPAVRRAADRLSASLLPVPIAHHSDCHDGVAIRSVLGDDRDSAAAIVELDTPAKAIAQVSRCRVVVTGSYHAAVFALAQGIPVVAIASTEYYRAKFAGLTELFGSGCTIVALEGTDASDRLEAAIVDAWASAPGLREPLLGAADVQIQHAREAYERLGRILAGRAGAPSGHTVERSLSAGAEI
jgi:polysaccharide pyruvyl transferase WcaK-like protein